jgi:hypothetical protein
VEDIRLPKFDYYLDESDPDILVLRRQDGAFVAAFSARGATDEDIVEAAKEGVGAGSAGNCSCSSAPRSARANRRAPPSRSNSRALPDRPRRALQRGIQRRLLVCC